jgi:hypothetical protein
MMGYKLIKLLMTIYRPTAKMTEQESTTNHESLGMGQS